MLENNIHVNYFIKKFFWRSLICLFTDHKDVRFERNDKTGELTITSQVLMCQRCGHCEILVLRSNVKGGGGHGGILR